jgi:hypothetical protein
VKRDYAIVNTALYDGDTCCVKRAVKRCDSNVILTGVNGNVIVSACGDDNSDDASREADKGYSKSVSERADSGRSSDVSDRNNPRIGPISHEQDAGGYFNFLPGPSGAVRSR